MHVRGALACAVTLPDVGLKPDMIQTSVFLGMGVESEYDGVNHSPLSAFA